MITAISTETADPIKVRTRPLAFLGGFKVHRKIQGNGPWSNVAKELLSLTKPPEKRLGFMMNRESYFLTTPTTS